MVELQLKTRRGSLNLDIECRLEAPWTVVFGPSGAGKSTLLRLIAGLEMPDSGQIAVHNRLLTDTRSGLNIRPGSQASQRAIAMVTQQPALFPHLSVAANIAFGIANCPPNERQQKIRTALELVDGLHLIDRSPRALSGGEAQRVALARALAPMPRLLLLDEPLSALEASARDSILARLRLWLGEQQIQTILVTHDAADALATKAEVALLREGRLIALGPAATVLASERERLLNRLQPDQTFASANPANN